MKVVFMGTPAFASKILEELIESNHSVVAVVIMPEKKGARGNKLISSPVKELALRQGIEVFQFENINENINHLDRFSPQIGVTAAYGKILKESTLNYFPKGIVNVHASILPFYRGASPVQCALLNGESEIGVSIVKTSLEVDAGDIYEMEKIKLEGTENVDDCMRVLTGIGGKALVKVLDEIEKGIARAIPQDHKKATFCQKIQKEDGRISFSKESAKEILNKLRAYTPWPSIFCDTKYGRTIVLNAAVSKNEDDIIRPGQICSLDNGIISVKCREGIIDIIEIKSEGRKALRSKDFLLGKPFEKGEIFSLD